MDAYDEAQICGNGHLITSMAKSLPQFQSKFCKDCGCKAINNCIKCDSKIKGHYSTDSLSIRAFVVPLFCDECGSPYPWTTSKLSSAAELVELSNSLNLKELEEFNINLEAIVMRSPNTVVAQSKIKRQLSKLGGEVVNGLKEILIGVISKTISMSIFGAK